MRRSVPKVRNSLSRAIEHELHNPGELGQWLEYLHMQAAFKSSLWYEASEKEIEETLLIFFRGDKAKVSTWFNTDNPQFGDISPNEMIKRGRLQKVYDYVKNAVQENRSLECHLTPA